MAKKKIKDLTLGEIQNICLKSEKKHGCIYCPLRSVCIVRFPIRLTKEDLNKKIEVEE